MDGAVSGATAAFYSVGDYFMLLGLIVSVVLVIISLFSIVSAFAKSVKEVRFFNFSFDDSYYSFRSVFNVYDCAGCRLICNTFAR